MFDRLGAEQTALHTPGCQGLKQREPIDPGGFHRHRLDATVHDPVCQGVQSSGLGPKGAPPLVVVAVGPAGPDLMRTNVPPSGVAVDLAHSCARAGFALGRS